MAKGNLFLGHARGKVGDVVFSRVNGRQITRALATQVANPRTINQNTQRAIFSTIAKAAAALEPIVNHSFANVAYGTASMQYFRKVNLPILRTDYLAGAAVNLTPKGGGFLPNHLQVSQGSLPAFGFDIQAGENPAWFQNDARLPSAGDDINVAQFRLVYPYLQGGDQLTLIRINKISGNMDDGDAFFTMSYDRIVFAPNAFDNDDVVVITADGELNTEILDMTNTTDTTMLVKVASGSGSLLGVPRENGHNPYGVALILSRYVNNTWQRSTQFLEICETLEVSDNDANIATYGNIASDVTSDEYLNQALESDTAAGVSGPYMQLVGVGTNAYANRTISVGETASLGDAEIEAGEDLVLNFSAFGTSDNPLVALDLTGTNVDGNYEQRASVRNNAAYLVFNVGGDGNLAGSYTITAVYRNGRAVANFTLSAGE